MNPDPLLQLISDSLELMNRSFAPMRNSWGTMLEFYHQFRKLWDRGIPVGMGLGHLLIRTESKDERNSNLLFIDRLGEKGQLTETIAILAFSTATETQIENWPGHAHQRIAIRVGSEKELVEGPMPATAGVVVLHFNTDRWLVQMGR